MFYSAIKYIVMGMGAIKSFYIADSLGATLLGSYAIIILIVEYLNYSNLGVFAAMNRDVAISLGDKTKNNKIKEILNTSFTFAIIPPLIIFLFFLLISVFLPSFAPKEFYQYTWTMLIMITLYQYKIFLLRYMRLYSRYYTLALLEFFTQLITLVGIIVFIESYSINAILWSIIGSNIFFVSLGLLFTKSLQLNLDFKLVKYLIITGFPMLLYSVILFILTSADRIVIAESFDDRMSLGIYQFGVIAAQGLFMTFNAITFLFYPRWIKYLHGEENKESKLSSIKIQTEIIELLLTGLSIFGIIIIPIIINYFLPQYKISILVCQLLLIAYIFNGMSFIGSTFLVSNNYQVKLIPIVIFTVLLAFALNYSFIYLGYGLYGIAFSTIISFSIYTLMIILLSFYLNNYLTFSSVFETMYRVLLFTPLAVYVLYEKINFIFLIIAFLIIYYKLIKKLIIFIIEFLEKEFIKT